MIELSVVIPTYNRVERLRFCLEALAGQTQSASNFEVIVVNDGGKDDTERMVSGLNVPYALRIVHQKNQGQNVARNFGVEFAQGLYCLFLDDDIIADPELISEHSNLHRRNKGVVGIGQMSLRFSISTNWFLNTYARGWRKHYEDLNQGRHHPNWLDCYAGNVSIPRSVFLDVGGFAPDIRRNHDIELGYRLQQYGLRFVYLPNAIGRQDEYKEVHELIVDLEKAGAAWAVLCRRHPDMYPQLLGSMIHGLRESLFLEFFWRFGVPASVLAKIGAVFGSTSRGQKWFRFINQYCRWRGYRRATTGSKSSKALIQGTPILMYHAFGRPGEKASRFVLPINRFIQQINWLKRFGFRVLSIDEFQQYQLNQILPPGRSVVITIDDGYAEVRDLVYPVLKRNGFPATVFVVSAKVGSHNDWTSIPELSGRPLLTWNEIREMAKNRIQFGAHSRTHPRLLTLSSDQLKEEIAGSKAELDDALRTTTTTFAYPYGEFDSEIQSITKKAGYQSGYSANHGLNIPGCPSFALQRIEVEGTLSLPRFLLALWFGSTR